MVGFLKACFAYDYAGLEAPTGLLTTADLDVTLLLFSIGLKLKLKDLATTEFWATSVRNSTEAEAPIGDQHPGIEKATHSLRGCLIYLVRAARPFTVFWAGADRECGALLARSRRDDRSCRKCPQLGAREQRSKAPAYRGRDGHCPQAPFGHDHPQR